MKVLVDAGDVDFACNWVSLIVHSAICTLINDSYRVI